MKCISHILAAVCASTSFHALAETSPWTPQVSVSHRTDYLKPGGAGGQYSFPNQSLSLGMTHKVDKLGFLKDSRAKVDTEFQKTAIEALGKKGESTEVISAGIGGLIAMKTPAGIAFIAGIGGRINQRYVQSPYDRATAQIWRAYYRGYSLHASLGYAFSAAGSEWEISFELSESSLRLRHQVSGLRPENADLTAQSIGLRIAWNPEHSPLSTK